MRTVLAFMLLGLTSVAGCSRAGKSVPAQLPPASRAAPTVSSPITHIPDLQIRNALLAALKADAQTAGQDILVEVGNGTINLMGTVDTLSTRNEAESVARRTRGSKQVINHLVVQKTGAPPSALRARIQKRIKSQPLLKDDQIHISMSGTTASLSGSVDSGYEQWFAGAMASAIPGVTDIKNRIEINRSNAARADAQIESAINRLLTTDPRLTPYNAVRVRVENGVASISGLAQNQDQQKLIVSDAFKAGAGRVVNELRSTG